MIASGVNAAVLQNPNNQINPAPGLPIADTAMVWVVQLVVDCCIGLVNVGLSAGLGAGGGAIWKNTAGKASPPANMTPA